MSKIAKFKLLFNDLQKLKLLEAAMEATLHLPTDHPERESAEMFLRLYKQGLIDVAVEDGKIAGFRVLGDGVRALRTHEVEVIRETEH